MQQSLGRYLFSALSAFLGDLCVKPFFFLVNQRTRR